jgi:ankyrin repeat protein
MSKRSEELIRRKYVLNEDLDSFVERHPRSNFPVLPIIVLFVIYLLFNYVSKDKPIIQDLSELTSLKETIPYKNKLSEVSNTVNFHQLVSNGSVDEVEQQFLLLDRKTINKVVAGMTPIMLAASRGSVEIIDLLLTQGADPNKRGSAQRTALQYAAEKNHIEAAKRLLAYGADIDAYDNGRLTPLIMAADRGFTELGLLFIEKGADVNIQHSQGWTALIDAARNGDEKLVIALLDSGANKNISVKNGMRAVDFAKQNGHKKIVIILGG